MPSVTPETTKRILPLREEAASAKTLEKGLSASELERKRKMAGFLWPKMGSMKSSEKVMRVGTEEAWSQSTMGEDSHEAPPKTTVGSSNFLKITRAGELEAPKD